MLSQLMRSYWFLVFILSGLFSAILSLHLSVNEAADAVLEEHVNLSGLDQRCHFANTESRMHYALPCAVCEGPVIGQGGFHWAR